MLLIPLGVRLCPGICSGPLGPVIMSISPFKFSNLIKIHALLTTILAQLNKINLKDKVFFQVFFICIFYFWFSRAMCMLYNAVGYQQWNLSFLGFVQLIRNMISSIALWIKIWLEVILGLDTTRSIVSEQYHIVPLLKPAMFFHKSLMMSSLRLKLVSNLPVRLVCSLLHDF